MNSNSISSLTSYASPAFGTGTAQSIGKKTSDSDKTIESGSAFADQQPPSTGVLRSVMLQRYGQFRLLPTMMIRKIGSCLTHRESYHLMLTCHFLNNEVQSIYRSRLRPEVARLSVSPIASIRNLGNVRPSVIGLSAKGEQTYQKFIALKAPSLSSAQYGSLVIQYLKTRLPEMSHKAELRQLFFGATLALGSREMPAGNRDMLLALIFASHKTSSPLQMGMMILGVCQGLGGRFMKTVDLDAVLRQILGFAICSGEQSASMIRAVCTAQGGKTIQSATRNALISKVLGFPSKIYLTVTMDGLCSGLGGSAMTPETRDALMARWVAINQSRPYYQMGHIGKFFKQLGGMEMTSGNRDALLAAILAASSTMNPDQIGTMIWYLYATLGRRDISLKNFEELNTQVIASLPTNNALLTGTIILNVFSGAGGTTLVWQITPENRAALRLQILESGRAAYIVAGLKLLPLGRGKEVLDYLELDLITGQSSESK